jgi:hypothetical protein
MSTFTGELRGKFISGVWDLGNGKEVGYGMDLMESYQCDWC